LFDPPSNLLGQPTKVVLNPVPKGKDKAVDFNLPKSFLLWEEVFFFLIGKDNLK